MKRTRLISYLALLLTLVLTAGMISSVGQTRARVAGVNMINTILQAQPGAVISNCLVSGEQQTVLLGELASGESVSAEFTLESREEISGQMIWYTDEDAPVQVTMDLWMQEGAGILTDDHLLEMEAGAQAIVTLTITAYPEILQARTVDVQVICEDLMSAFRVELIPDPVEETTPPETTEPEETEPEETEPEVPSMPGDEIEEPIDPIEPSEPDLVVMAEETEPTDSTEQPGEPGEEEITPQPGDSTGEEETDEPTEPESPATADVTMVLLKEFEITNNLPLKLTASGDADWIRIGLANEEPLPALTRYSTDGGTSWYMLYFGGYIVPQSAALPEGAEKEWRYLLDFSRTELLLEEPFSIEVCAYLGEEMTGSASAVTTPRAEQVRSDAVQILTMPDEADQTQIELMLLPEPTETVETTAAESVDTVPTTAPENTEESEPTEPAEPVEQTETVEQTEPETEPTAQWIEGHYFTVLLPIGWEECEEIRYFSELLIPDENGTGTYIPVEWNPQSLDAVVDAKTGMLIVYMGGTPPTAGTYRLTVECIYEGICFEQMQMTFFINYSTRSDVQSEEVPDNE